MEIPAVTEVEASMPSSRRFLLVLMMFSIAAELSAATITIDVKTCIDGQTLLLIQGNTLQWHNLQFEVPGVHSSCPAGSQPTFISTTLDGVPVLTNFAWTPTWSNGTSGDVFSSIFTELTPSLPGSDTNVSLSVIQARNSLTTNQLPTAGNGYELILDFNDAPLGGPAIYEGEVTVTNIPEPTSVSLEMVGFVTLFCFVCQRRENKKRRLCS